MLDCALSFDFDLLLLLLLLLSLEYEQDFDLDLFRFLSLDVERDLLRNRDLLLCNRDHELECDLLPLDLESDCLLQYVQVVFF